MYKRSSGSLGKVDSPSLRKKQKTSAGDAVQEEGRELLKAIHKLSEKKTRRSIAAEFQKLPSKKTYPDYYKLIKKPVSLDVIERNLEDGEYVTLDLIREDLLQMCNNAKRYNQKGSMLYSDAAQIARLVKNWADDAANYSEDSDAEGVSRETAQKSYRALVNKTIKGILKDIRDKSDRAGRRYIDIFLELPDRKLYPDYYDIIKEPVSITTLEQKMKKNPYTSIDTFHEQINQMWQNAFTYNDAKSYVAQDAKFLQKAVNKLVQDAKPSLLAAEQTLAEEVKASTTKLKEEEPQSSGAFKIKLGIRPTTPITPVTKVKLNMKSAKSRPTSDARTSPAYGTLVSRRSETPGASSPLVERNKSPTVEPTPPSAAASPMPPTTATPPIEKRETSAVPSNNNAAQHGPPASMWPSTPGARPDVPPQNVFEAPIVYANSGSPLIQCLSLCAAQIQPPTILHVPAVPGVASLVYSWTLPIAASSMTISPSLCTSLLEGKRGYSLALSLNGRKVTASRQANGQHMIKNSIWDLRLSSGMNCIECVVEAAEGAAGGDASTPAAVIPQGKARERMVVLALLR